MTAVQAIDRDRRRWVRAALAGAAASVAPFAQPDASAQAGRWPAYYPPDYERLADAARREGRVVIYSTTDFAVAQPLIRAFELAYPGVSVVYQDMNSFELRDRFLAEATAAASPVDVLWSSAMSVQFKLVNDGHALVYESPEKARIPAWAAWRNEAWGTSYEPVAFVHNTRLLAEADAPSTHADFARLLGERSPSWQGRVATYDIERSATSYLFAAEDARTSGDFWAVARSLGRLKANLYVTTAAMLERVASGECALAYNVIGSYALRYAATNPALSVRMPTDYTLVASRVAFIARRSTRPNAARLWLDFCLSRAGQQIMADRAYLFSLRDDVQTGLTARLLGKTLGTTQRPIVVGPGLLAHEDRSRRDDFLARWRVALGR
jgi:iron(III) transport system substrate-binding protein